MKNTLKINHENRTLVMDRTFAKAASFVGSNEYNLLQDARRDYPSYQVTLRSIKRRKTRKAIVALPTSTWRTTSPLMPTQQELWKNTRNFVCRQNVTPFATPTSRSGSLPSILK